MRLRSSINSSPVFARGQCAHAEALEPRRLLATVFPTANEQYMVELYNWARANPTAAAAKYGVDLNEGPPGVAISANPKQPLAVSPIITHAARTYAQYMIDVDQFSHNADGLQPNQRMQASGYPFHAPGLAGENAGLSSVMGYSPEMYSVNLHFRSMFVDNTIGGRWHRVNIMSGDFKEIGSGIATGIWQGFSALISVQNFGTSGSGSFLTGVAYADSSNDQFYTPGEQMAGVTVTAIRESDGALFATTTWGSGGYTLPLPNGEYSVWGGGGALGGWVRYDNVVIGSQNVKLDFRPDLVGTDPGPQNFAHVVNGQLSVQGTPNSDVINVEATDRFYVTLNGVTTSFELSAVTSILISAGAGSDEIIINNPGTQGISVIADEGNDYVYLTLNASATVWGGNGDDWIYGSNGHDQFFGGGGNDWIYGAGGYDYIQGEANEDRLYGGSGFDNLLGGSGNDSLFGQSENDTVNGGWGADYMVGGSGNDTADYSSRSGNLSITLDNRYQTANDGEAGELDNVLDDIESVLGGSGNDSIVGSAVMNFISGGGGNDTLTGGGGFDLLFGGIGDDLIIAGDNEWDYVDGGTGLDEVRGDLADALMNVEQFVVWIAPAPRPIRDPYRPSFG